MTFFTCVSTASLILKGMNACVHKIRHILICGVGAWNKKAVGKGVAADVALPVKRVTVTVDTSSADYSCQSP